MGGCHLSKLCLFIHRDMSVYRAKYWFDKCGQRCFGKRVVGGDLSYSAVPCPASSLDPGQMGRE